MATATNNLKMTTETAITPRGFAGVPCCKCGETGNVWVRLEDMTFQCSDCEAEMSTEEVRELIDQWERVLSWVALAPEL